MARSNAAQNYMSDHGLHIQKEESDSGGLLNLQDAQRSAAERVSELISICIVRRRPRTTKRLFA